MAERQTKPIRKLLWRAYVSNTLIPVLFIQALFLGAYLFATEQLKVSYGDSLERQAAFQQLTLNRLLSQQIGDELDRMLPEALKEGGVSIPPLELIRRLRQQNSFQLADNDYFRLFVEKDGSFYDVRSLALVASSANPYLPHLNTITTSTEGSLILDSDGQRLLTWTTISVTGWRLLTLSANTTSATMVNDARQQLNNVIVLSGITLGLICLLLISLTHRSASSLSRRLLTPLQQINQVISAIGRGVYQPKRQPIEIEELETSAVGLERTGRELGQARQELLAAKENLEEINQQLEQRVTERTIELESAYLRLQEDKQEQERLFERLRMAQVQLLESEKMASLGQLAAGVAHEINNPMTYIIANVTAMKEYSDDLLGLIEAQENALGANASPSLEQLKAEIDYDFLKKDLPVLIDQSLDGADRVKEIVQGLRDFSHTDQRSWERSDLHSGLDSTLKIAHNEIKHKAQVVKEYGDIPEIDCLPSQLNQVFLNLFVNAAQAIKADGTITLRTRLEGERVRIDITDTGEGMDAEVAKRIFDPFFTTKPVGQGTGLGLSLSFGIIQAHQGRVEVDSAPGKGTTFSIWLPVKQSGAPSTDHQQKRVAQLEQAARELEGPV